MHSREFVQIRRYLDKTQGQLAQFLSVSTRAIHSYEQGWRNIPAHAERQLLFLLYLARSSEVSNKPCWEVLSCPNGWRNKCIAWEHKVGTLCWFVNGTFCQGRENINWKDKMKLCRECDVLRQFIDGIV